MSVFRATATNNTNSTTNRDPYPINRAKDEVIPDGPTERIDDKPRKRAPTLLLAVVLALVATNLAGVSLIVAWRAANLARAAAAHPPTTPPASHDAGDAGYAVTYAQEPLRVQVGCAAVMFLDLDEPRANADEQLSDLRYDSRCGRDEPRLTLGPGASAGSQVRSTDTDAADCAKAIRISPVGPGASVAVRKGVVLCVLTAATPARMVLVEITDAGPTGTAGMRATSWRVDG